ncbi:MAG: precorrin-6A reductase [Planctomycetota bacterium]
MIFLLGGTSETAPLAMALAQVRYRVLVSTATEISLDIGAHQLISRRSGHLDTSALASLLRAQQAIAVVDATHPYALTAHATAKDAAAIVGIPCLRYVRSVATPTITEDVIYAANHEEAARVAVSFDRPILLTTGSRNLELYARAARAKSVPLIARVLPEAASLKACQNAGLAAEHIVAGRGPFSVEENQALIRKFSIGVLVTKDSGQAGGVPAKLESARLEHCRVVVVERPTQSPAQSFDNVADLVKALAAR